jgi:hypothetical protein
MHHEEEERYHERHDTPRRHPRNASDQQNFRSRWEEPRPFMSDRERQNYEEEMRERVHRQGREHRQQDDISRHQHGFSDDHHTRDRREQQREWHQGHEHYGPDNQHARDRWQQYEPPMREQRHRGQSRRDQDWEDRGW